jgi:hypothetical protein
VSTHSVERFPVQQDRPRVPEKIFIRDFEAPPEVFRVDRSPEDLEEFRVVESARLTRNIVWRVRERVAPATSLGIESDIPRGPYWLVIGRFERVNQGSRAMRMLLGFGAGGTKLDTIVEVYDLSEKKPRLITRFRTTGGSNAQPGAVANLTWYSAALSGGALAMTGLRYDIVRTSREITAMISQELAQQGAIPQKRALRPKKLGKWP